MAVDEAKAFELYKLEYERAAIRYEDIYKAVWQIFSYLAVSAGAILAFGKDALGAHLAGLIACIPLLVWFWATFEPLNRYGDKVEDRLANIESALNEKFGTSLRHYTDFKTTHLGVADTATPVSAPSTAVVGKRARLTLAIRRNVRRLLTLLVSLAGAITLFFASKTMEHETLAAIGVFGGLSVILALLSLAAFARLRVRIGVRVFSVALHVAFILLLGRFYWHAPSATGQTSNRSAGLTLDGSEASAIGLVQNVADAAQTLKEGHAELRDMSMRLKRIEDVMPKLSPTPAASPTKPESATNVGAKR